MKIRLQNQLLIINILAILLFVIITFVDSTVPRIILGLPFVLYFPGYTLTAALFPRREQLRSVERVALSLGLSIAIVPFIGFILNYTPWGVKLYPILISLTIFILVASLAAWYQQRRLPEAERLTASLDLSLFPGRGQGFIDKALSMILIVTIVGAIGAVSYALATLQAGDSFTKFYILGLDGKVESYPKEMVLGDETKVIAGIVNHEHEIVSYRLEVRINGITNNKIGPLLLKHEEKWEEAVSFIPDRAGEAQKVEFILYKNGQAEPCMKPLYLLVNVREQ